MCRGSQDRKLLALALVQAGLWGEAEKPWNACKFCL